MVRSTSQRWMRGVAVAAAAILAGSLVACAPGESASTETGATDRELSIAVSSAPSSFDPAQLDDGQSAFVWGAVFDNLVIKESLTGDIKPWAAEDWEYSEDGRTLTFTIRDGMTFSSGDPVTAEAVAATMERTRSTPGAQQGKFLHVTGVTAPDERTVVVAFDEFDPAFLPQLANASGVVADPATFDEARTATDPVGSGAYVLDTEQTVPGTSYVLNRRDDYWNLDAVPFKTVKIVVLQDATASFNALQSGEVNAATVRAQQLAAIQGNDSFTQNKIDAQAVALLNILDRGGDKFPELGDARVRQAMSMAIDREGILNSLLGGAGMTTEQIFSPFSDVFDESLNETYSYDPTKAKELLAEAGYPNGFNLSLPSTFITTAFEPTLSQQMADIGITLNWVPVPPQQAASVTQSGEYGGNFFVSGFASYQADALNFYGEGGFNNPNNYEDATMTKLWDQINTTVDPEAAMPFYKELNEHAVNEALTIPIVFTGVTWVTRDGVTYLDDGASGVQNVRLFGVAN